MNPVRAISREVAGAWRSLRYDLRQRRASAPDSAIDRLDDREIQRRAPSAVAPPQPPSSGRVRQRPVLAAAGLVLIALAGGGILAMVTGVRALLDPGRPPAGLPAHAAPAPAASSYGPQPAGLTASSTGAPALVSAASPTATRSGTPRHGKTPKPPVPTPAPVPTCSCTAPPHPAPSTSPSPSPTPSPSDVSTPTPSTDPPSGTDPGTTP